MPQQRPKDAPKLFWLKTTADKAYIVFAPKAPKNNYIYPPKTFSALLLLRAGFDRGKLRAQYPPETAPLTGAVLFRVRGDVEGYLMGTIRRVF
jgi:hypothetical protein